MSSRQVANGHSPPSRASRLERCVWTTVLSKKSEVAASTENQKLLRKKLNLKLLLKDQAVWHSPSRPQAGDRPDHPFTRMMSSPFPYSPPLPTTSRQPSPVYLSFSAPWAWIWLQSPRHLA